MHLSFYCLFVSPHKNEAWCIARHAAQKLANGFQTAMGSAEMVNYGDADDKIKTAVAKRQTNGVWKHAVGALLRSFDQQLFTPFAFQAMNFVARVNNKKTYMSQPTIVSAGFTPTYFPFPHPASRPNRCEVGKSRKNASTIGHAFKMVEVGGKN